MQKKFTKILSVLLVLIMAVSVIPMSAINASAEKSGYYTYTVSNSQTTITDVNTYEASGAVAIPTRLGGYPVTAIGPQAFAWCKNITSIKTPYGLKTIGKEAFGQCQNLTSITISDSVTTIGDAAFAGCKSLTSIILPDSVTTIGDGAFNSCDGLTSISIPDSVTSIGKHPFIYCDNLTSIKVDNNNRYYSSDSYGVLFNKNKTALVSYPIGNTRTNYLVPYSVTSIDAFAFDYCDSLTSVTIPDSVTTIGDYAFRACGNITDVYYGGTKEQWYAISVGDSNDYLLYATIHFNYHYHKYDSVVTLSTCTERGYTTYTCECGDSYVTDYVDATGHSHTAEVTTPATHTATGVMTYTCACGDTYTETIGKIAEHKYESVVTAPTCEEKGYTTYTCECGDTYIADYVDATGHSHTAEVTIPATHTATGVMTYTCACGDTYTETIEKIAEHNHNAVVTAPTCTEQGYTTYTCECGDSYVDDYVPEKGHDEGIWSVTKPSTPTESGVMHLFCGECGFVLETKVIPATGKVRGVAISDVSLDYKASTTITPSITVDSGVKYTVTYSSSNPSVASVDANGKVMAGKTGSATITVTVTDEFGNTVSDTCTVKVNYNWWQWIIVIVLFGWIWY